jgi:hypothetical protein
VGNSRIFVIAAALVAIAVIFVRVIVTSRDADDSASQPAFVASGDPAKAATPPDRLTPGPANEDAPVSAEPDEPAAEAESNEPQDPPVQSEYRGVPEPVATSGPVDPVNEWQRAFGKEVRDENWAGPLETEIQRSLEPQINLGHFYVSNIECRATLCEIRLLAQGSLQRAELERFESEIYKFPWNSALVPALSSGIDVRNANENRYEAIWIFEKKPESRAAN